jgi:uncharacterized protein
LETLRVFSRIIMYMFDWNLFGTVLLQTLTLTFMLVGLFGLIIPIFPGLEIMWLTTLIYAAIQASIEQMNFWRWVAFGFITLLMLFGSIVDNIIITRKMRDHAIPWWVIGVAYLASILASLFLTPLIGIIAAPAALFGAEFYRFRDWRKAFDSAKAWMIGFGWTFLARFSIGVVMIVIWLLWAWT